MIIAVTLADGRIVALSAAHVLLMEPGPQTREEEEDAIEVVEVTMINGKKFVLQGKVQDLAHKFNVSRR